LFKSKRKLSRKTNNWSKLKMMTKNESIDGLQSFLRATHCYFKYIMVKSVLNITVLFYSLGND
jgi:hypothetical protein